MYRHNTLAACLAFTCIFIKPSSSRSVPATPQCPQPCGDNVADFCPLPLIITDKQPGIHSIPAPLNESDGWDIRVLHTDLSDHANVPFSVSIYDEINYKKFLAGDASAEPCKEDSALNKWVNCISLQTKACRGHKMTLEAKEQYVPYTTVVITAKPGTNLNLMLRARVDVAFMPDEECWSLGLPCSYWSTLFWLCFAGAIVYVIFRFRTQISEGLEGLNLPGASVLKGPWRIFSGRLNGVEEMEARLAQSGSTQPDVSSGNESEPYRRL